MAITLQGHSKPEWTGSDLRPVMDPMGHNPIQTTQTRLHALLDAEPRNLDAFRRIAQAPDSE